MRISEFLAGCPEHTPPEHVGHWREFHRGHGCLNDPDVPLQTREAANRLVRVGAQFIEPAIRDNPDGPVQIVTEVSRTGVDYVVYIGDPSDTTSPRSARAIWTRTVAFGHTDRTVAGGAAFVEAARTSDQVAWDALTLLEHRRNQEAVWDVYGLHSGGNNLEVRYGAINAVDYEEALERARRRWGERITHVQAKKTS